MCGNNSQIWHVLCLYFTQIWCPYMRMQKDKFLRNILSCMLITFSSCSFFYGTFIVLHFFEEIFFLLFRSKHCSVSLNILPFYCFSSLYLFVFHPKCTYDGSTWCNLFIRRVFCCCCRIMKFKSFLAKKY